VKDRNFFTELKRRNVYRLAVSFVPCGKASPLFELSRVLVRVDHVVSFIVNADHKILLFTSSSPRSLRPEKT
jgi:hypothetical protein